MKHTGALALLLLAAVLGGCKDADQSNNTAVLGGSSHRAPAEPPPPTLTDAQGRTIPAPPAPAGARPQMVRSADEQALAAWIADDHAVVAMWTPATQWSAPQPLERIYGESRDVQLASNGAGRAIAVWHHRVGNIHSLRFSVLGPEGWSLPDVVPGAMPRPAAPGAPPGQSAPRLQMDAQGNVVAQWPSGFEANEMQVARYTAGEGWGRAASEPVASAPNASLPPRAPSSAP
jgi:hypothetical protein